MWSAEPTHEPLVTKELFDAAANGGRRSARLAPRCRGQRHWRRHPQTKRAYLLRSMVVCELCGRRMFGKTKKGHAYYSCQPGLNHGKAVADRFPGHPPTCMGP